jgi:hypothetical protein
VIIFDGNGEAISFNDDTSPRTDQTEGTKVSINAQVNRGLSLDWFYNLLTLFPNFPDELKSAVVVGKFKELPAETRDRAWRSLSRVQIHIVDPRPHYRRTDAALNRAWKMDNASEVLRQLELDGIPGARELRMKMRLMVAESLIHDSAPVRVQSLGRVLADPFPVIPLGELSMFVGGGEETPKPVLAVDDFGRPGDRHLVGNVAAFSAKASAVFHLALDVVTEPSEADITSYRFNFGMAACGRMVEELLPTHAFDKGNRPHLELLENTRHSIIEELAAKERFNHVIRQRKLPELESKQSYYIQAADFAGGIAADIYGREKLLGVVSRFEYVTYNGARISRADAEEEIRKETSDAVS